MHLPLFNEGFWIFSREQLIQFTSQICIIAAILGFIVLVGMLGRYFFFHSLASYFETLLRKIPIINKIYGPSKDIVDAIFSAKADFVRKAVIVPYPTNDQKTIGIATGEYHVHINGKEETLVSVFIPSTPNATAGYLCNFPKHEIDYLEMSADDALKTVMSLGMIKK